MTAKEIRKKLIAEMGNKKDGMNLYHQIQRSLKEEGKAMNTIWYIHVTRNDYADPEYEDREIKVVHFTLNDGAWETCL